MSDDNWDVTVRKAFEAKAQAGVVFLGCSLYDVGRRLEVRFRVFDKPEAVSIRRRDRLIIDVDDLHYLAVSAAGQANLLMQGRNMP